MDIKKLAIWAGAAAVGNEVFQRFVLGRFVQQTDGFGADEIARALTIALALWAAQQVL